MAINIGSGDDSPIDAPGTDQGYGRDPVGMDKETCKAKAQSEGGVAWDEHAQACWRVFGKAVQLTDVIHSVMEGFEIVNFNFHATASQSSVPTDDDLPGDFNSPGIGGKVQHTA